MDTTWSKYPATPRGSVSGDMVEDVDSLVILGNGKRASTSGREGQKDSEGSFVMVGIDDGDGSESSVLAVHWDGSAAVVQRCSCVRCEGVFKRVLCLNAAPAPSVPPVDVGLQVQRQATTSATTHIVESGTSRGARPRRMDWRVTKHSLPLQVAGCRSRVADSQIRRFAGSQRP